MFLSVAGCKGRYSGFPGTVASSAIKREREVSKQDVTAATAKLKVGMTDQEVRDLLAYDIGMGQGREGAEHIELMYLVHGILVEVKFEQTKDPKVEKLAAFDVRTFHGW